MAGGNLLQSVSQPARATPQCEQNERRLLWQLVHSSQCRKRKINIGPLTDHFFNHIPKLGVLPRHRKLPQ